MRCFPLSSCVQLGPSGSGKEQHGLFSIKEPTEAAGSPPQPLLKSQSVIWACLPWRRCQQPLCRTASVQACARCLSESSSILLCAFSACPVSPCCPLSFGRARAVQRKREKREGSLHRAVRRAAVSAHLIAVCSWLLLPEVLLPSRGNKWGCLRFQHTLVGTLCSALCSHTCEGTGKGDASSACTALALAGRTRRWSCATLHHSP